MNLVNKIFVKNTSHKKEVKSVVFSLFASILFVFAIKGYVETFRKNNPRPSEFEISNTAFRAACDEFRKNYIDFNCENDMRLIRKSKPYDSGIDGDNFYFFVFRNEIQSSKDEAVGYNVSIAKNGEIVSILPFLDQTMPSDI